MCSYSFTSLVWVSNHKIISIWQQIKSYHGSIKSLCAVNVDLKDMIALRMSVDIMFAGRQTGLNHTTSLPESQLSSFLITCRVGWELPFSLILTRLRLWVLTHRSSFFPMMSARIWVNDSNLQILGKLVTGVSIPVTCKIRILPSVIIENMFSFNGTVALTDFMVLCGLSLRIQSV